MLPEGRATIDRPGSAADRSRIRHTPRPAAGRSDADGTAADRATRARYVMVGGFLGAGKTTALGQLARFLDGRGLRVGLITNDQSSGLVDTAVLRSQGFEVEEITGGCFCCRFHSLHEAASRLDERTRPDVFLAEPVGSCTDLVATVSYPLRRIYGRRFAIAPLSVMVDPLRAARVLGLEDGRAFSPKVQYVYRKQLEEADVIVLNKTDLIDETLRERLEAALQQEFPEARLVACSARDGDGLEDWLKLMMAGEGAGRPTMEVDYDLYAEGEAALGWLNCTVRVEADGSRDSTSPETRSREAGSSDPGSPEAASSEGRSLETGPLDGDALLSAIAADVGRRLDASGHEVAHLKMTLDPGLPGGELAVLSLVRGGEEPELRASLLQGVRSGWLIVNLRAEAPPEALREILEAALDACGRELDAGLEIEHLEHFRPARPEPVHRELVTASGEPARQERGR